MYCCFVHNVLKERRPAELQKNILIYEQSSVLVSSQGPDPSNGSSKVQNCKTDTGEKQWGALVYDPFLRAEDSSGTQSQQATDPPSPNGVWGRVSSQTSSVTTCS